MSLSTFSFGKATMNLRFLSPPLTHSLSLSLSLSLSVCVSMICGGRRRHHTTPRDETRRHDHTAPHHRHHTIPSMREDGTQRRRRCRTPHRPGHHLAARYLILSVVWYGPVRSGPVRCGLRCVIDCVWCGGYRHISPPCTVRCSV